MTFHRYPGLFGDPRSGRLWTAVLASLALHVVLFAGFGSFRILQTRRTFFAPFQVVDLVEKSSGPPSDSQGGRAPPAVARPRAAEKPPAAPKREAAPAPAPKPKERPEPKPKPGEKVIPKRKEEAAAAPKPKQAPPRQPAPKPAKSTQPEPRPQPERYSDERVAERIAQLRKKMGAETPAPAQSRAGSEEKLRNSIESIRQRLGPSGSAGEDPAGSGRPAAVGVRGGGGTLAQELLLRAYYNRLWDHVNSHWTIPPPLEGKAYTAIVSAVVDRRGSLLKTWIEESSGSEAFDQSALRALERSEPLPPVPDTVPGDSLEVGFRFHGE